jgi:ABC-type multidrug transport system fused ATPase/permease subunit
VIVIDPTTLDAPLCCTECGADIPIDTYPQLVPLRDELVARKAAEREAAQAAEKAERERRKAEKGREQLERERQREEKRREEAKRRALEDAAGQRTAAAREAEKTAERQRREAERQRRARQYRATLKVSTAGTTFVALVVFLLGLGAAGLGVFVLKEAKAVFQEMEGLVFFIVAAILCVGALVYAYLAWATRVLALKMDAIRDAVVEGRGRDGG